METYITTASKLLDFLAVNPPPSEYPDNVSRTIEILKTLNPKQSVRFAVGITAAGGIGIEFEPLATT